MCVGFVADLLPCHVVLYEFFHMYTNNTCMCTYVFIYVCTYNTYICMYASMGICVYIIYTYTHGRIMEALSGRPEGRP